MKGIILILLACTLTLLIFDQTISLEEAINHHVITIFSIWLVGLVVYIFWIHWLENDVEITLTENGIQYPPQLIRKETQKKYVAPKYIVPPTDLSSCMRNHFGFKRAHSVPWILVFSSKPLFIQAFGNLGECQHYGTDTAVFIWAGEITHSEPNISQTLYMWQHRRQVDAFLLLEDVHSGISSLSLVLLQRYLESVYPSYKVKKKMPLYIWNFSTHYSHSTVARPFDPAFLNERLRGDQEFILLDFYVLDQNKAYFAQAYPKFKLSVITSQKINLHHNKINIFNQREKLVKEIDIARKQIFLGFSLKSLTYSVFFTGFCATTLLCAYFIHQDQKMAESLESQIADTTIPITQDELAQSRQLLTQFTHQTGLNSLRNLWLKHPLSELAQDNYNQIATEMITLPLIENVENKISEMISRADFNLDESIRLLKIANMIQHPQWIVEQTQDEFKRIIHDALPTLSEEEVNFYIEQMTHGKIAIPMVNKVDSYKLTERLMYFIESPEYVDNQYQQLIESANTQFATIDTDRLFSKRQSAYSSVSNATAFSLNHPQPRAFTREAYEGFLKKAFEKTQDDITAIYQTLSLHNKSVPDLKATLSSRYLSEFELNWFNTLNSIQFTPPERGHYPDQNSLNFLFSYAPNILSRVADECTITTEFTASIIFTPRNEPVCDRIESMMNGGRGIYSITKWIDDVNKIKTADFYYRFGLKQGKKHDPRYLKQINTQIEEINRSLIAQLGTSFNPMINSIMIQPLKYYTTF